MVRLRRGLLLITIVLLAGCMRTSAPFTDDFSDPASGWAGASTERYTRGYVLGKYVIQIDVANLFVWAVAQRNYEDVSIDVTATSNGARDNHYGVLCRYTGDDFYYFAISSDGYYAIFRRINGGSLEPLTGRSMLRSPVINTDERENRLLAVCEGNRLTFYVNDEQIAQVEDDALRRGDVGMAAGLLKEGSTQVLFDNLEVEKYEEPSE